MKWQRSNQLCFTDRLKAQRPVVYGRRNCTFVLVCDCLQVIALVRGMGPHLEHYTKQASKNSKLNFVWDKIQNVHSKCLQTICSWSLPTVMHLLRHKRELTFCIASVHEWYSHNKWIKHHLILFTHARLFSI